MSTKRYNLPDVSVSEHPEWKKLYDEAWRLAFKNLDYPSNPAWLPQMTCMPGVDYLWQWDSCFMTLFSRYSNNEISALNNLDNLYRLQRDDGYISMTYQISTDREAYGERVNPPLFAWVEWESYRSTCDLKRLERIYPILKKYFLWLKKNRTRYNGLYWFEDPGSSGMDNSPRGGYPARDLAGSDICHIDMSCQQVLAAEHLAKIANVIGEAEDVATWHGEGEALKDIINRSCWSERIRFYYDCFTRFELEDRCNLLACKTVASFWSILANVADDDRFEAMLEHLNNPDEFNRPHPIPSLSADDPNYDEAGAYWLGGVWAPTNYMIIRGLWNRGRYELARELTIRHLQAMYEVMQQDEFASIWEVYSPEKMCPATIANGKKYARRDFVGWSGLGPIAMQLEFAMGLDFNALENTVSWRMMEDGKHSVENILFNGSKLSLCAEKETGQGRILKIECEKTFKLCVLPKNDNIPMEIEIDAPGCEIVLQP